MKPIGTPVFRVTASCIRNSFPVSGKRHLILTGDRGSGKTTLLNALFPESTPGITTWAIPRKSVWLKENATGLRAQIGVFRLHGMHPIPEGFRGLGLDALLRCLESDSPWATIDEIGFLESQEADYCNAIRQLFEKKQVAAVVRKQALPFLQELIHREDAFVVDLDQPYGNLGCVIMASGMGVRFGGNKLMADFRGQPLITRAFQATEGIFARRVVVTRHREVVGLCQEWGIECVLHGLPHRSDTVRLGLEAVGDVHGCLFCPGDQPLLRQETVAALALLGRCDPTSIWRTGFGPIPGAPVLFPKWSFPELLDLPEGKGGGFVVKKYPERVRTLPVRDKLELMDVDRPETLQKLAER